jgi:hypothetical protein
MNKQIKMFASLFAIVALIGVAVFGSGLLPGAVAQTRTPAATTNQTTAIVPTDGPRTITVVGEGSVKIKPDIARVNIGVETFSESVKTATTEASETLDDIIAALEEEGIAEKDMQTSGFSVWSERMPGPEGRGAAETTYRVNNSLTIVVRDLDTVGAVLDAAIEAGANAIHGVNFAIEDPGDLESDAREDAVADARAKAAELAELNGLAVGPVLSVSEIVGQGGGYYNSNFARDSAAMAYGGGGAGIQPGELQLTMRLQITYAAQAAE